MWSWNIEIDTNKNPFSVGCFIHDYILSPSPPPNQHGSADILEIFYSVWASECYRAANNLTGINVENVRIENI